MQQKTKWSQFGTLITVFFFWGFVAASNDILIPVFKEKLHLEQWQAQIQNPRRVFYFSAFGTKSYYDVEFQKGDWLVFGKETKGLPDDILQQNVDQVLLIPILGPVRGYNVATSAAIVLFEAIRQLRARGEVSTEVNLDPALLALDQGGGLD